MIRTLLLFLLLPFFGLAQTDLVQWTGTSDLKPTLLSNYVSADNFTGSGLTNGNPTPSNDGIVGTGWPTGAIDLTKYFQITIKPILNGKITLNQLLFTYKGYMNAYQVRYSKQSDFSSSTILSTMTAANPNNSPINVNLALGGIVVNPGEKVYIRFYAYNGNGNWKIMNNNTLKIQGTINTVPSPLNGSYKIGSTSDSSFPNITEAINVLNDLGVSGPVTFLIDENQLVTSQLVINQFTGTSTTNTVTIKPNTGKTISIEAANLSAVFKLNGADNIVFDGSNNGTTSKNLTIYNNNSLTYAARSVIWIASENTTNGALNNQIKNIILQQNSRDDNLSIGVFGGGTSSVGSTADAANSNNTIQNVTFAKVGQAVYMLGSDTNLSTGWKIQSNIIGGTAADNKPFLGVYLSNAKDYEVSANAMNGLLKNSTGYTPTHSGVIITGTSNGQIFNNTIRDVNNSTGNNYCAGIYIEKGINSIYNNTISTIANGAQTSGISINGGTNTIYGNTISGVSSSSDVNGIALNAGTAHIVYGNTISAVNSTAAKANGLYINNNNNTVYNNIISNIYSSAASSGINYNSGTGGKIYFNTIAMSAPAVSGSACLTIAAGSSIGIKDNIFYSSQTAGTAYLINSSTDHTAITEFNNNAYFLKSTGLLSNKLSSGTYTTLAGWKAVSAAKEQSSIIVEPIFISTTDFHLAQNPTNSGIHAKGSPISGITTDIDNETRSTTLPDMGADEIIICGQGDQTTFGVDSWIGYVYKWTNAAPNPALGDPAASATNVFIGNVTEPMIFDRNVGAGAVRGVVTNICGTAPVDNFFVRYKMKTTTAAGTYNISLGGDDGVRLYIDNVLVLNRWNDHSYILDSRLYPLTAGPHEFVLEYYENAGSARTTFSYGLIKGDNVNLPFGINVWNVYGFTKNNLDLSQTVYAGTNVDSNLNINTVSTWAADKSPSVAAGWQGAPIPVDNFTVTYKRQGFPCGNYQIQVVNCDDDMVIYLNESTTAEYTAGQNINAPVLVKSGQNYPLNKNSKIEIRLREDAGDAKMAVSFIPVSVNYDGTTTPSPTSAITIAAPTTLNSDIEVCSCTINPGVTLTVPIGKTLTVNETTIVGAGGKLLIQDGGSFLQKSTDSNAYQGAVNSFELQRKTNPVRRYDFTYWSSPVTEASAFTLKSLSPDTLGDKYYSYTPGTGWTIDYNGTSVMKRGQGYIVRAPQWFDINTPAVYPASFIGIPNNGNIIVKPAAAKWNLIGNPYPSAINGRKLINDNGNVGSIYLWTHNSPPSGAILGDKKYNYTTNDYAVMNGTGGVKTAGTSAFPTGYIAAGQGFFINAANDNDIVFTNDMRGGNNSNFYKTTETSTTEENRLWLNLTNEEGAFKQILVGYIAGASNTWDLNYDARTMNGNTFVDFYSINEGDKLTIQGRGVPFENTDTVPLGYKTSVAGDFTISIDQGDGLFNDQNVYLEDKTTGTIQDLRKGNYTFTTDVGTFIDRFTLRYTNKTLGTGDFESTADGLLVSVKDKVIKVTSAKEQIKEVSIFDITGKLLYNKKKVGAAEFSISNLQSSDQVLLVKVILENDYSITKKVIF